ncbi:porin family protein [Phenylobacterium sp.]|uniref:porin family protein n=1 Tax=Phenylobacterium sp. TaxID=1871053 RepID=UPI00286A4C16|nr:porin family protein [Phenylobacterium sp.]
MKTFIAAATALAAFYALPGAAQAQDASPAGVYGSIGYANAHTDGLDLGAVQGRLGYRFNTWFGVEGELAGGVKDDRVNVGGVKAKVKLSNQEAIYGVAFAPLSANTDLIGRIGYGSQSAKASALGVLRVADGQSWNFGVGAQHHFDGVNGVRVDYTREQFTGSGSGHADVVALGYAHRF